MCPSSCLIEPAAGRAPLEGPRAVAAPAGDRDGVGCLFEGISSHSVLNQLCGDLLVALRWEVHPEHC